MGRDLIDCTKPDVTPLAIITTKLFTLHNQPHMLNMLRTCNKLNYSHSVIIVGDDGTHQTSMMVHVALPPAV